MQYPVAQDHIPVRIPVIVWRLFHVELRRAFCKPRRNHRPGHRIRHERVGIAVDDVIPVLLLRVDPLQINRRDLAGKFHRRIQLDDMRKFVGDHIPEPVMAAAQFKIQRQCPDDDFVIIVVRRSVRVIIRVLENQVNF
ncbi:MAG: hypothetical protein MAGBODY4_01572 [Candidatus Marinimicrobia bacterium]|nr:hypothetical protein [Candidatus Neomarinimicrobiota bacterium]